MPKLTAGGKPVSSKGHEIEIKFRTDRAGLERVLASPLLAAATPPRTLSLRTIYYDTGAGGLRNNGIVLRLRRRPRAIALIGLKSLRAEAGNPFRRTEIEVRSPRGEPDLQLFDADTAAWLTKAAGGEDLEARFEIRTKRRTVLVRQGNSTIEVALDDGVIVAGERTLQLFEVELELKTGEVGDVLDLAARLVAELPLALDFTSKSEKGFRLTLNEAADAVKATPVELDRKATLDDAIHTIVASTLSHFVANWGALREHDEPDAIHQLRVALRRLRSALRMFAGVLPQPACENLREDAKRIASGLGPARDCDAFRASIEQGPGAEHREQCADLLGTLEERRQSAYGQARALIEDKAATLFVLKVQSFLVARGWRGTASAVGSRRFARKALNKLHRRGLERGRGLPAIPDEARHDLRITLKNLRYAIEFLGGLFGRRRARKAYAGTVSGLQELLGIHNDEVTARRLLADPVLCDRPATDFLLGWYARGAPAADKSLGKSWKKFTRAGVFWE